MKASFPTLRVGKEAFTAFRARNTRQAVLREKCDDHQDGWDLVGDDWPKYRQAEKSN